MPEILKSPEEFDSLLEVATYFNNEMVCLRYLEQWLHNGDIRCPHCGFDKVYRFSDGKRFKCSSCRSQFTAKKNTIFEHSPIPLQKWFLAIYLITAHKKGISSCQLSRDLKIRRNTAWFMAHRIRQCLSQKDVELDGVVQSDETFVGGKNKNRHIDKKVKYEHNKYRASCDKVPVLGMLNDKGFAKTTVLQSAKFEDIKPAIMDSIKSGSTWVTDNYLSVRTLGKYFKREVVNHQKKQFLSSGGHSTNGIEGFWSHLKRMIIGVYHQVSPKYLQRYCDEQTFRYNTRHMSNGERFALLFTKVNCRINYKQLTQ